MFPLATARREEGSEQVWDGVYGVVATYKGGGLSYHSASVSSANGNALSSGKGRIKMTSRELVPRQVRKFMRSPVLSG